MDIKHLLINAFENDDLCDVEIRLEDQSIVRAHTIVLKLQSNWFRSRLGGNWVTDGPVLCNEYAAPTMRDVIRYLYTCEINVSVQNVEELYTIADFYSIQSLTDLCTAFLERNIGQTHVLDILMITTKFSLIELKEKCLNFIDSRIEALLISGTESFYLLPTDVLIDVLRRDSLCVHEELLFDNVLLWMEAVDQAARQDIWRQITPHMRWTSMSYDFFVAKVANTHILDPVVSLDIMRFLTSLPCTCVEYKKSRCTLSNDDILIQRFRGTTALSNWIVDDRIDGDRIAFSVNHNLKLRGVLLYGNTGKSFLVSVALCDANYCVVKKANVRAECQTNTTFPVLFPKPVTLVNNEQYTIVVNITGGPTYAGEVPTARVSQTARNGLKIKCTFYDVAYNGMTSTEKGQVKGLILRW